MNINIDNFEKINKNLDELIRMKNKLQNILLYLEEEPTNDIYINHDFFEYLKKENLYNILDNKFIDFIIEKEKELNNIELNILYKTDKKYKKQINKLLRQKEEQQKIFVIDDTIDFEATTYQNFENQLYQDYLLAI